MGKILSILAIIVTAWIFHACNTAGCTELRSAIPSAEFCSSSTGKPIKLDNLQITGVGVPGDSVLLVAGESASTVYLPMRATAERTVWELAYHYTDLSGITDTIALDYERQAWFAGEECGAMYRYRITSLRYTTAVIDSIAVTDSLVTNVDRTTLKIYFRTQ